MHLWLSAVPFSHIRRLTELLLTGLVLIPCCLPLTELDLFFPGVFEKSLDSLLGDLLANHNKIFLDKAFQRKD